MPTANWIKIPVFMKHLLKQIHRKKDWDIITNVASIHAQFEQIHPFGDGNGRIGRLLIHAMLLGTNLPPAVIREQNRQKYFACLQKAQLKDDFTLLEDFLCDGLEIGFQILERSFP